MNESEHEPLITWYEFAFIVCRPNFVYARNDKNVAVPNVVFENLYAASRTDWLLEFAFDPNSACVVLSQAASNTYESSDFIVRGGLRGPPKRYSKNGKKGLSKAVY